MSTLKQIIALNGLPGTGKSTLGRWLSEKLDIPFWQSDHTKHLFAREILGREAHRHFLVKKMPYPEDLRRTIQLKIYNDCLCRCIERACVLELCLPSTQARMDFVTFCLSHGLSHYLIEVSCRQSILEQRLRERGNTTGNMAHLDTYLQLQKKWEADELAQDYIDTSYNDRQLWDNLLKKLDSCTFR